jgi:hypothetical protein
VEEEEEDRSDLVLAKDTAPRRWRECTVVVVVEDMGVRKEESMLVADTEVVVVVVEEEEAVDTDTAVIPQVVVVVVVVSLLGVVWVVRGARETVVEGRRRGHLLTATPARTPQRPFAPALTLTPRPPARPRRTLATTHELPC